MNRKRNPIVLILCIAAVVAVIVIGVVLLGGNGYSEERLSERECFSLSAESEAAILENGVLSEKKAVFSNGRIYLPYDLVSSLSGNPFYYERSTGKLYLTTQKENHVWTAETTPDVLTVNADGMICVSTEIVDRYAEADVAAYFEPARAVIRTEWKDVPAAAVTEDTKLRQKGNKRSPIVADVFRDESLFIIGEEEEGWIPATTEDGWTGYVEVSKTGQEQLTNLPHTEKTSTAFEKNRMNETIKMVWHYVDVQENNDILDYMLEETSGINVICPTWITIKNKKGEINSLADPEYVKNIRQRGMKIWTMVSDYTGADGTTGDILMDPEARGSLIRQITDVVKTHSLDGVNIDFETITQEQADAYLQFLRELSIETHKLGILLSTDNYVPIYTSYYDRREQAKIVDYIVIMGYDEHTEHSSEPGSVASLPFVRDGIERTLKEVPAEQIILGVPFYTRVWTQPVGSTAFETTAIAMPRAREFVNEKKIDLVWNENLGQYYGSVEEDSVQYSIWMEDVASLEKKLELVKEFRLSGASAWRLGLEEDNVWEVWNRLLK